MKLHSDTRAGAQAVNAHGAGYVSVAGKKFTHSVLLSPSGVTPWGPARVEDLTEAHLQALGGLGCDVLLLGTGERQYFPSRELLKTLWAAGVAPEIMDTGAACRTYNVLLAEGRTVAAALILP